MKKLLTVSSGLLICASLLVGGTAAAADLKIGVVNMGKLLSEAPQAQAAKQALQSEFEPQQRELLAKQKEIQALGDKLDKNGAVMSEAEKQSTEGRLRDLQREFSRRQSDYMDDVNMRRNEELGKLQRLLLKEVQDFAKEQGYDLVIGDGVLYAGNAIDVTDKILGRLQRDYKSSHGSGKNP